MTTPEATPDFSGPAALDKNEKTSPKRLLGWAMWDWGTQPFNTVIITFVFAYYITNSGAFGNENYATTRLAWATGLAGLFIALLAPVLGQNSDRSGRTVRNLRLQTWLLAALSASLFFVRPDPSFLWLGLFLLGAGSVVSEIASVNYNATIDQVATQQTVGRVSGFGWGMGYLGGIMVMILLLFTLILPDPGIFGVTHDDAMHVRVAMIICGIWTLVFTIPAFLVLKDRPRPRAPRIGVVRSYQLVWASIRGLWTTSRQTVYFLLASALFRDGLAGVFAFGAVLAGGTFGMTFEEVMMFGIAANVVAGLSTIFFGLLDDRLGPKRVILVSLAALVILGLAVFALHSMGPSIFWILGLTMTAFVGPAQAASRSFLARVIPEGKSGEVFGLYATTGRAVSFLSPTLFGAFITLGAWITGEDNTQYWGILGIALVLIAGLAVMIPVKEHTEHSFS